MEQIIICYWNFNARGFKDRTDGDGFNAIILKGYGEDDYGDGTKDLIKFYITDVKKWKQ